MLWSRVCYVNLLACLLYQLLPAVELKIGLGRPRRLRWATGEGGGEGRRPQKGLLFTYVPSLEADVQEGSMKYKMDHCVRDCAINNCCGLWFGSFKNVNTHALQRPISSYQLVLSRHNGQRNLEGCRAQTGGPDRSR